MAHTSVLNKFPFRKFNRSFVTGIPSRAAFHQSRQKDKPFWLENQGCHYSPQLFMICMVQLIVTQRASRKWSKLIALKRSSNGCGEYRSEEARDNTTWNESKRLDQDVNKCSIKRIKFQTCSTFLGSSFPKIKKSSNKPSTDENFFFHLIRRDKILKANDLKA